MAVNRDQLDVLVYQNETRDWWQPERFRRYVKPYLPDELETLADPPPASVNYNCFLYALGLADNQTVVQETNGFLYDTFVQTLLDHNELLKTDLPADGDFVLYKDCEGYPDLITHMGLLQEDGRVISKWAWGPVVRHELWDVPRDFGDTVFYATQLSPARALELYEHYQCYNRHPRDGTRPPPHA